VVDWHQLTSWGFECNKNRIGLRALDWALPHIWRYARLSHSFERASASAPREDQGIRGPLNCGITAETRATSKRNRPRSLSCRYVPAQCTAPNDAYHPINWVPMF